MDRNLQREGSSCANGCTLSEEEVRRTIEELVRYILSRFLSVAVNTVFTACCRANGGGLDETDGASSILPVKPVTSSLSAIFSDCGNHVASEYYSRNTKKLFFHLLPDLQLPEPIPEVDLDQIIESCIADWFATDFQSAIQDMLPSARILTAVRRKKSQVRETIRRTFYIKYLHCLLNQLWWERKLSKDDEGVTGDEDQKE